MLPPTALLALKRSASRVTVLREFRHHITIITLHGHLSFCMIKSLAYCPRFTYWLTLVSVAAHVHAVLTGRHRCQSLRTWRVCNAGVAARAVHQRLAPRPSLRCRRSSCVGTLRTAARELERMFSFVTGWRGWAWCQLQIAEVDDKFDNQRVCIR